MKKISDKYRHRVKRLNIKLRRKPCSHKAKVDQSYFIEAPKVVDIGKNQNRKEFLNFIGKLFIRRKIKGRLRICFEKTTFIFPEAMILFLAKLRLAKSISRSYSSFHVIPPKKQTCDDAEKVRQVLYKVGVYELTGQKIQAECDHPMVVSWSSMSGSTSEPYDGQAVKAFLEVDGLQVNTVLHKAFKEALINIGHHAYAKSNKGNWMAFIHIKGDVRTVVVCDLGIGIPESIRQGSDEVQEKVFTRVELVCRRASIIPRDCDYIRGSVKYGLSVTGKKGRGKGLHQMKQVVDSLDNQKSILNIYSNKGLYKVSSGVRRPRTLDYSDSIGGTIITWTVPVSAD